MSKTLPTLIAEYQQIQKAYNIEHSKAADFMYLFNTITGAQSKYDYEQKALKAIYERNLLAIRLGEIEQQIEKLNFPE